MKLYKKDNDTKNKERERQEKGKIKKVKCSLMYFKKHLFKNLLLRIVFPHYQKTAHNEAKKKTGLSLLVAIFFSISSFLFLFLDISVFFLKNQTNPFSFFPLCHKLHFLKIVSPVS